MEDAEEVPRTMAVEGRAEWSTDALVGRLMAQGVGAVRSKIASAAMYGFVETGYQTVTLTDLGQQVLEKQTQTRARQRAFMRVPLFSHLAKMYDGKPLPPRDELETDMLAAGVKIAEPGTRTPPVHRARSVFRRGALVANLIDDDGRLSIPPQVYRVEAPRPVTLLPAAQSSQPPEASTRHDPLIRALMDRVPASRPWPKAERERWKRLWNEALEEVYGPD
jgi:hypothetical protein